MKKPAIDDNALPHLQKAVNPELMAAAFEEFLQREYPGRGLKVKACGIGRVYHKPGKDCGIIYHLQCQDRENRSHAPWFYGRMCANGDGLPKPENQAPAAWPGCGFWKPVRFWPEMRMQVNAFPYDAKLPYLGQLLEPEFVKQQVEANLPGFGLPGGWECREVVCHTVKYMPFKRCVLRYQLLMADALGNQRQIAFYGKTYNTAESRYVYDALRKICDSPGYAAGQLNIPAPIAHLDEANTLWQRAWEGKGFSALMREIGWNNLPDTGYPEKIGALLAALHQVAMPDQLAPGPSLAMVIENAGGDADDITDFLPEKQAALRQITKTLEALAPRFAGQAPQATIHGTFKVAQLLCRENKLGLIDFDSIASGDPLYDLAELITSLLYLRVSDRIPEASISKSVELILSSYQKQTPWAFDRRRLAWYVVAFLLGKIHSSLKRLEPAAVENMPLAFALVQEWLDIAQE
jgi:hypothetical protein